MHPLALAPLVVAGVVAYVGLFHLALFWRLREDLAHLSFGLTCLCVALYDICCAGVYGAESLAAAFPWQRGQIALIMIFGVFFLRFVSDYTGRVSPLARRTWAFYAITVALLVTCWDTPLLLDPGRELIRRIPLPGGLAPLQIHEAKTGPLLDGLGIFTLLYMAYVARLVGVEWRSTRRRPRMPLLLAVLLLIVSMLNDMAVATGLVTSVYVFEYAYLGMVLLMAQGLTASLVEATETRRALHVSRRNLASIVNNAPLEIFLKDLDGRYLVVSPDMAANAKRAVEDMVGKTDEELYPAEVAATYRRHDAQVLAAGRPLSFEEQNQEPEGERTYLVMKFPIQEEDGTVIATGGIATDISARKRLEAQMREAQKLESLGLLAGGIAHDFNNLLVALRGHVDLAVQELAEDAPARPHLMRVKKTALRASELIHQLLTYAGEEKAEHLPVDLKDLIAELGSLVDVTLPAKTSLHLELPPALPPVTGDRSALHQIVLNLVTNASDAMGERGGTIHLRARVEEIDERRIAEAFDYAGIEAGPALCIEVEDEGPGMDDETRRRIFEPFFTTKSAGRGLGLAAVLGIVRSHGGAIEVGDAPTGGCRFRIFLPVSGKGACSLSATASTEKTRPSSTTEGARVLVIDDDETVREVSEAILVRHGYAVDLAPHGEEGLRLFAEAPEAYTLVLLDLTMPRLSGMATLNRLREISETVPVIFFSGFSENEVAEAIRRGRAQSFLPKPFDVEELLAAIRNVLGTDAPNPEPDETR